MESDIIKASMVQDELYNDIMWLKHNITGAPPALRPVLQAEIDKREKASTALEAAIKNVRVQVPEKAKAYFVKAEEEKDPGETLEPINQVTKRVTP